MTPYVTSAEEILWGSALIAMTMVMHCFGMVITLGVCRRYHKWTSRSQSFMLGVSVLILASFFIVLVHLGEVVIWATFFVWSGAMPNRSTAYYFALMDYTTVGSEYSLPNRWRLLGGMISTAGLLTFAWPTTVLLTLAQTVQDRQLSLLSSRRKDHINPPVDAERDSHNR